MFKFLVKFISKNYSREHQARYVATGQPRELRLGPGGVKNMLPGTLMMPCISHQCACVVMKGVLFQKHAMNKKKTEDLTSGTFQSPLSDLTFICAPRWRKVHVASEFHTLPLLRWMLCHSTKIARARRCCDARFARNHLKA